MNAATLAHAISVKSEFDFPIFLFSVASDGRARPVPIVKGCQAAFVVHAIRQCNACVFLASLGFSVTKVCNLCFVFRQFHFSDFSSCVKMMFQQFAVRLATSKMAIVVRRELAAAKSVGWAMIVAW